MDELTMIINNLLPGGLSDFFVRIMCQRAGMTRMTRGKVETGLFNIVGAVPEILTVTSLGKSVEFVLLILLILVSPSTCPIICEEWL